MKKKILSLALALVMCLGLAAPAGAAKIDVSNMPGHEVLAKLPEILRDSGPRPTTLEQADVYHGNFGTKWTDESTLWEITALVTASPPERPPTPRK